MKLYLDAVGTTSSGSAVVLWNLLYHLLGVAPEVDMHVFLLPQTQRSFRRLVESNRILYREIHGAQTAAGRLLWQQVRLPLLCRREQPAVLMSVTNVGALFPAVPQVIYCHQALLFFKDEVIPYTARQRMRASVYKTLAIKSMKKSAFVIAQTHAMRDIILRETGLAPERVVVVYPGVPVGAPASVSDRGDWRHCLEKIASCALPKIVYVSHPSEHKNFEVLLRATAVLKRRGIEVLTVLTLARDGVSDARYMGFVRRFEQLIDELEIDSNVLWTGILPNEAIVPLIRSTDLFVFPSLVESFPQPLAEALSCGAAMVLSDRPYAREIAGEAAVYFDPYQPEDLAQKVCAVLSDESLRAALRERALKRARSFSYESCARQIWDILQQASLTGRRY